MAPLEERDQSIDEGVDGRIILKWIFQKWSGDMAEFIWLRIETGSRRL
jgi:hypothetical protein